MIAAMGRERMDERMGEERAQRARRPAARHQRFAAWLRAEAEARGLTGVALAELLGVKQPTVSQYLGGQKVPHRSRWVRLARAFGTDVQSIASLIDPAAGYQAPGVGQAVAPILVPVLGVASADPDDNWSHVINHVSTVPYRRLAPGEQWFAVEVRNDCLLPDVRPGWVAIYDPRGEQTPGRYAVANIDGATHIKRLELRGGQWVLTSNKGDARPVDEVVLLGMVVQFIINQPRA